MTLHSVQETLKLTGKSRSQLYRDRDEGLVSYRTGKDGRQQSETSGHSRDYGRPRNPEPIQKHMQGNTKAVVGQA